MKQWKRVLGFYPDNLSLYQTAITHTSSQKKDSDGNRISNERLEYLGDAVLNAIVAHELYQQFEHKDEGFLTRSRSKIVRRSQLNDLCFQIGLDRMLNLNNVKQNAHDIYGNAVEALVGAVFLDKGYVKTAKWVKKIFSNLSSSLIDIVNEEVDYKSHLLEWGQHKKKTIDFVMLRDDYDAGFDEHKYVYQIKIDGNVVAMGEGTNKRQAQQNAAQKALKRLK
ncbi:MAG: ribonuclease III [Paludibacteraceae bacterium]|nr:ribonuclease III [Paludibacteraceae bacterium]